MANEIHPRNGLPVAASGGMRELPGITLLAVATAGLLYFIYFQAAPWIWGSNIQFKPEELMPWMHRWLLDDAERDGRELYALYILMFLDLLLVVALTTGWNRLAGKPVRHLLALPAAALSFAFVYSIGFHPPVSTIAHLAAADILVRSLSVMAVILPIIIMLNYLQKHFPEWSLGVTACLLAPVCFIATQPLSWDDIQFIFAPALRLLHGAALADIYFQYDTFLSLLALAWMKLQLDLDLFQVLAQLSYYLLFLALFVFSRHWFSDKHLPAFLLAATVLLRIYAGHSDASYVFQVTPLRLDLWLILLILVYYKGAHHWSAGLFCGLMLLLHKNFGIIYSAACTQLLLTLCLLEAVRVSGWSANTISALPSDFLRKSGLNLVLILSGAMAHYLIFMNTTGHADFDYQRLGIGFMKIASNSFYWYVVIIAGLSFTLLLKLRTRISHGYFAAGLCLIYLMIGNSLYFFGRSHENNIINISTILVLLFFFMLDMIGKFLAPEPSRSEISIYRRNLPAILAFIFITSVSVWYCDSATDKAAAQAKNAINGQLLYPPEYSEQAVKSVVAEVKAATHNSNKVYFASIYDFLFNYYGGYAPLGYYSPFTSWISRQETNKFLQGLIDQGYYLVVDEKLMSVVQLAPMPYHVIAIRGNFIIWKV